MSDSITLAVRVSLSAFAAGPLAPLELEMLRSDTVNDVKAAFGYSAQVQHITSFDLVFQKRVLESQAPLAELVSESDKTLYLDAVPKAYTAKSIVEQLLAVRGLAAVPETDPFAINAGLSKIGELQLDPINRNPAKEVSQTEEKSSDQDQDSDKKDTSPPTAEEVSKVENLVNSFFGPLPANFTTPSQIVTPAVRALYLSAWNPVPLTHRGKGHLIYILLQTLENEILHITGSTSGFYVNRSSSIKFDPSPRDPSHKSFNLYDLIAKVSKDFVNQVNQNNEKLAKLDPVSFLKPQITYLSTPWITKPTNVNPDFGRVQFEQSNTFRDFNDEIQSLREFPGKTFQEKIICERLLAKTAFEFSNEAVKGAMDILNGGIAPMEPNEDPQSQIFLHNGIFYSFAADSGSFADKGGNEASRASSNQDLQTLNYLNLVESRGIYTLLTTIVDYAGKRVVCQTPVPGLFSSSEPQQIKNEETGDLEQIDGEPLTKIDYGRDENEGTVKSDNAFVEGLESIRKVLLFKKEKVEDAELVTSPDIKGMVGTDKRKYIIDLYNATPLDIEFIEAHYKPESQDSYPHRQTVVRLEAMQQWWNFKVNELISLEAAAKGIDLSAPLKEGDALPDIEVDESKLLFSVDAFQTSDKEDANVRDLSKFIKSNLIPRFIEQFDATLSIVPVDGAHLTSYMHKSGVNIRYLGEVAKELESRIEKARAEESEALAHHEKLSELYEEKLKARRAKLAEDYKKKAEAEAKGETFEIPAVEKEEQEKDEAQTKEITTRLVLPSKLYENLLAVVNQELIARSSKHVLRSFSTSLPVELVPSLVSHFHNCLLGFKFNESPNAVVDNTDGFYTEDELAFTKLTPASVKELIEKDIKIRYRVSLPSEWTESVSSVKLQREIAHKFGIQWTQRDYHFTKEAYEQSQAAAVKDKKSKKSRQSTPVLTRENVFTPEDVSLAPLIKTTIPRATTGEQFFEAGRLQLSSSDEEKKKEGLQLITEAVTIYEQTFGQVHPEIQRLYATLSQVYRELKMGEEATLMARRSATISERVFGLDSHETVVAFLNLVYFEAENGNIINSLKAFARISQIWASTFDNAHISIPNIGSDVITLLQERSYFHAAIAFSEKLIEISEKLNGGDSYISGFLKYRLGYLYASTEKFDIAFTKTNEAQSILEKFGSALHYLTKEVKGFKEQLVLITKHKEHNAKILKQQAKLQSQKALEANKKTQKQQKQKQSQQNQNVPKVDLSNKTVDEILDFVLGKNQSTKKESKESKKSKKSKK